MSKRNPNLPKKRRRIVSDHEGRIYKIEVDIKQTDNYKKYGLDGIKAVFKVIRLKEDGNFEELILIDNHQPLGFHSHNELPEKHDSR